MFVLYRSTWIRETEHPFINNSTLTGMSRHTSPSQAQDTLVCRQAVRWRSSTTASDVIRRQGRLLNGSAPVLDCCGTVVWAVRMSWLEAVSGSYLREGCRRMAVVGRLLAQV